MPVPVSGSSPTCDPDVELTSLQAASSAQDPSVSPAISSPALTVAYKNACVSFELDVTGPRVENILTPLVDIGRAMSGRISKQRFYRLKNATGRINPGTMTLILAPPGHGKSSLLRALAGWLPIDGDSFDGTPGPAGVLYNGLSSSEAAAQGVSVRRLCSFVDQVDEHLSLMTVQETLAFAHKCTSITEDPSRVPAVIKMLGLEECKDTILGNAMIRGVSGGQKRRVTLGEMLVGDARALFLDEYTNGLDTATAEDITRGLRAWTRATNGSVVATAQQPTPGLFAQFDEVIIMGNSQIIYHGPRVDLVPFFASMGYVCPGDVDVCDFVVDCVSQPRVVLQRLNDCGSPAANTAPPAALESSVGALAVSAGGPCLDVESMIAHFRRSPFFATIEQETNAFFDRDSRSKCKALTPTPESEAMYKSGFVHPVATLFGMVLSRQALIFTRNKGMILPRVFQNILMGLIYGSAYYQIGENSFILRVAVFLMMVSQTAFGNIVELPFSVESKHIAVRQSAAGFYPSWVYVVSAMILSLPIAVADCVLLGTIMYFMSACYAEAGTYFIFLAILFFQSMFMTVFFRFATAITPDEASAESLAGSSAGIFVLLGGFFVTMGAMPVWLRWLMWITPSSWSVRALANNEFLSSRYPPALGRTYLRALDFEVGAEWIGYAIIYYVGTSLVFMILHSLALKDDQYEGSRGTRLVEEEEMLESAAETVAEDAFEDAEDAKEQSRLSHVGGDAPENSLISVAHGDVLRTLREAVPFSPVWLSFKDIRYTVAVKDSEGKTCDRPLLRGVNGFAEPGKLTALMGASGAGKTTLLDVLAGRKNVGKVEGEIKLNGRFVTPAQIASSTGYVEQFDSLLPFDTVRETLTFAAELRLPSTVSDETKDAIVAEVMEILELTAIGGLVIGSPAIPSLSPSQLKRVNIGCELVANPAVLFLDEPTTGLDSRSAQTVMRVVRRIARSGRSVICTIHQPSAELFYLFDRLVLLASGGHQVFFGGLGRRCRRFIPYLESIEGVAPCPARYNPASWMLEELGVGQNIEKPKNVSGSSRYDGHEAIVGRFIAAWTASRQLDSALHTIAKLDHTPHTRAEPESDDGHKRERAHSFSANTSVVASLPTADAFNGEHERLHWSRVLWLVLLRTIRGFWRNPPTIVARTIAVTVVSILVGLIYFDFDPRDQTGAVGIISVVVVGCIYCAINHSTTALPNFTLNRVVLYRELASNMYPAWMWGISNFIAESIFSIHSTFMALIPLYFLAALDSDPSIFFKTFITYYLMVLAYTSMSCLLSSVCQSLALAGVFQGMYIGLFMMLAGVAVPYPQMPQGWVWLFRALPTSHMTEALAMTQVGTCSPLPLCGRTITVVEGTTTGTQYLAEYVQKYLGFGFTGFSTSLAWIVLFIFVIQVLSLVGISYLNFSRR